jgi:DNA-binding NtrC family response regulator
MGNPCLLVIDDDPKIIALLQIALTRTGYRMCASNSGEEALDIARCERPDAVLLDLCMPDRSGEDVLCDLKSDECLCDVPVIVATGQTDLPELSGAFATLTKPFKLERLYRTIDQALSA